MSRKALPIALIILLSALRPAMADALTMAQYVKLWSTACQTERYPKAPIAFSRLEIDAIHTGIHVFLKAGYESVRAFGAKPPRTLDQIIAEACGCVARKLSTRGGDLSRPPSPATLQSAVRNCTENVRFLSK